MSTLRAIAAAAALAVAAWFGLEVVQAQTISRTSRVIFDPDRTPADIADARSGLGALDVLRPGQDAQLLRAQLDVLSGDTGSGLAGAVAVTRAEPDNLAAWRLIAALASSSDPALAERARAQLLRLQPPIPPA